MIKYFISALLTIGIFSPLLAQESIIKDFSETRRERKYCFYPSTLRMINLEGNDDYNELVNHVEKLLIYQLDSVTRAERSYSQITKEYKELGYEEFASMSGGEMVFDLVGKTSPKQDEFVGVFSNDELAVAFYLKGKIAWQKIYPLFDQLQQMDMIDIMNFNR